MIAHAGIVIFIFGNKLQGEKVVLANGVLQEFKIAKEMGLLLIPIGATEYLAHELWKEITDNFEMYHPGENDLKNLFLALEDTADETSIIKTVVEIINRT